MNRGGSMAMFAWDHCAANPKTGLHHWVLLNYPIWQWRDTYECRLCHDRGRFSRREIERWDVLRDERASARKRT